MIDLDVIEAEIDNTIRHYGGVALMQCSYVKDLITRLRQAEKDAARYRWLRSNASESYVSKSASSECFDNRMKYEIPLLISYNCIGVSISLDDAIDMKIERAMQCHK